MIIIDSPTSYMHFQSVGSCVQSVFIQKFAYFAGIMLNTFVILI